MSAVETAGNAALSLPPDPLDAAVRQLRAFCAEEPLPSGRGLEALIAGATLAVPKSTWLLPGRRERSCALLRGCAPDRLDAARPYRVVPPGTSPVARALQAVGLALSGGDGALVFCGTGSVGYGGFSEALSLAALRAAPVTFVVSWYATPGPFAPPLPVSPAAFARALGLSAEEVDGTDAAAVQAAVGAAKGPTVIEARLLGKA